MFYTLLSTFVFQKIVYWSCTISYITLESFGIFDVYFLTDPMFCKQWSLAWTRNRKSYRIQNTSVLTNYTFRNLNLYFISEIFQIFGYTSPIIHGAYCTKRNKSSLQQITYFRLFSTSLSSVHGMLWNEAWSGYLDVLTAYFIFRKSEREVWFHINIVVLRNKIDFSKPFEQKQIPP